MVARAHITVHRPMMCLTWTENDHRRWKGREKREKREAVGKSAAV